VALAALAAMVAQVAQVAQVAKASYPPRDKHQTQTKRNWKAQK